MKLGFYAPQVGDGASRRDVQEVARKIEEAGYAAAYVADHVVAPVHVASPYPFHPQGRFETPPQRPILEPLTTLAFLAGCTSRVRLVVSVLVLPYRHPLYTAKVAASIDVLSGGRLVLGVGAGWMAEEFVALGNPRFRRRGAETDEQLEILRASWTGGAFAHEGAFFSFDEVAVAPAPQQTRVPIWVGGHSDAAMRRAVRFGDALCANAEAVPLMRARYERLVELSASLDRETPPELTLRAHVRKAAEPQAGAPHDIIGPTDHVIEVLDQYRQLGVAEIGIDNRSDGIEGLRRSLDELQPVLDAFQEDR